MADNSMKAPGSLQGGPDGLRFWRKTKTGARWENLELFRWEMAMTCRIGETVL